MWGVRWVAAPKRGSLFWRLRLGAVLLGLMLAGVACAPNVEVSHTNPNCYPYYQAPSKFGTFSAQQPAYGGALQWGAYPAAAYRGTRYVLQTRLDGRKQEFKDQNYMPHGSIPASRTNAYRGKIFSYEGTVYRGTKVVLTFSLACVLY